ncbi:MAG: ATP-binding protein [Gracilimonas sp.]|jgi:serine/threonine-protein kinase RsbW|nr:ATP-binding protein [Gracilimonas sp.]
MGNKGIFKRDADELQFIFQFLREHWKELKIEDKSKKELELSVEEIFMNMVRHNTNSDFDIKLLVEKKDGSIILKLSDHEIQPFDITKTDDVDFEEYFRKKKTGGLGIHLVKKLMDDIQFTHSNGISTITITKKI